MKGDLNIPDAINKLYEIESVLTYIMKDRENYKKGTTKRIFLDKMFDDKIKERQRTYEHLKYWMG